jgi:iron complex outermembrane recepter protein
MGRTNGLRQNVTCCDFGTRGTDVDANLKKARLKTMVAGLALAGMASHALAQQASPAPQRIEITGSSIKRIAGEGALPIQVISAEDIQQQGILTAEDLLNTLGANSANTSNAVSSNTVFGPDQDRLTGGASFANLRGLGPTGTLVLLNGRRISTHGQSGAAVDLNAIPMAAVQRVEVLKDGASAIYGTDAIGGVINFILKTNYEGGTIGGVYAKPFASGGGDSSGANLTFGFGNLDKQRFNVLASGSFRKTKILRGVDRDWATGFQPDRQLSPETTSATHANIVGSAGTALLPAGSTVGNTDPTLGPVDATRYTNLNLLGIQGRCQETPFGTPLSANVQLWDRFGYTNANSRYRCGTDYGRLYMLLAPTESTNVVARANFRIGDNHTAFIEAMGSRTDVDGEYTPFQFTSNAALRRNPTDAAVDPAMRTHYPAGGPHYLNLAALPANQRANQFDPTQPIAYRLRMTDWGYRTNMNRSSNQRIAAGADGDIGDYSYKLGISTGKSKGETFIKQGYARVGQLIPALNSGLINPFVLPGQSQTPAAQAAIDAMQARGRVFFGETTLDQVDGTFSGPLMKLPAGSLDFAVGFDVRKESYFFSGSTGGIRCYNTIAAALADAANSGANLDNAVLGCPGNAASPKLDRDIKAVFAELQVPIMKGLTAQLAVRQDDYSQVGSTTNPKIALRWQPVPSLVMRASANTGFRAPTPQQLNLGTVELQLTGTFRDPELCPVVDATNPQCQRSALPYRQGGNPTLKPETSKQSLIGLVWQPIDRLSIGVDLWQVELEDRIRTISPATMIANYSLFSGNFVRDPNTRVVQYIQAGWVNASVSDTKGLDITVQGNMLALGGRVTGTINGTRMMSHREALLANQPMQQFVGKWSNTTLYLPWRVNYSLGYKKDAWNTTLSANYSSGYEDEDRAQYTVNEPTKRFISKRLTFNLFTTWTGIKGLTVTAGIVNLFDKDPNYTWHNVDNVIGAGWDPRTSDPRGRTGQMSVTYKF